jgi:hypothetical protein
VAKTKDSVIETLMAGQPAKIYVPEDGNLAITVEGAIVGGALNPDHEISECGYFENGCFPKPVREHFRQRLSDFFSDQPNAYLRSQ